MSSWILDQEFQEEDETGSGPRCWILFGDISLHVLLQSAKQDLLPPDWEEIRDRTGGLCQCWECEDAKGQRRQAIDGPALVMIPKSSPKQQQEETWVLQRKASVPEWNPGEFTW